MIYVVFVSMIISAGLCTYYMIELLRDKELIGLILLIPIVCCIAGIVSVNQPLLPNTESDGEKWHGKQVIEKEQSPVKQIAIPGIDRMTFKADQTVQKVNIYNPETNDCSMKFILILDGKVLWQSEKCYPGYGFYEIELVHGLEAGKYNASLVHVCERDGQQLNSANLNFELIVN